MLVGLLQTTAAVYLAAGIVAAMGVVLPSLRLRRAGVALLAGGAGLHAFDFAVMHTGGTPPPLTDLATAVSYMAFVGVAFFLLLLLRWRRLAGLAMLVAPAAFLGVFFGLLPLPGGAQVLPAGGSWSHTHVLLASAGLSLLGVAGLAGVLLLVEDRRLKRKRPWAAGERQLPSIETLDRVNAVALGVGFTLLSLGVVTGMLWLQGARGRPFTGSPHEVWSAVAWAIYAVLVVARFGAHQRARHAAVSAVAGFAFLVVAVIGVGLFA